MSIDAISFAFAQPITDPAAKLVFLALADAHNQDTGQCNPSIATIMEMTSLSRSTVKRKLAELEDGNWIIVDRCEGEKGQRITSNWYVLNVDREGAKQPKVKAATRPGTRSTVNLGGVQGEPRLGSLVNHANEPEIEPLRNPPPKSPPPDGGGDLASLFEEFWEGFGAAQRDTPKDRAKDRFEKAIANHPDMAGQIIEASRLYRDHQYRRRARADIDRFLRRETFLTYANNPPMIDKDGHFEIRPGTGEWNAWIGHIRKTHGQTAVDRMVQMGVFRSPNRWPETDKAQRENAA